MRRCHCGVSYGTGRRERAGGFYGKLSVSVARTQRHSDGLKGYIFYRVFVVVACTQQLEALHVGERLVGSRGGGLSRLHQQRERDATGVERILDTSAEFGANGVDGGEDRLG